MATAEEVDSSGGNSKNLPLRLPLSCEPPGPNNPPKKQIWIVFGGTGHLGRSLVKTALIKGDRVTMVGRAQIDSISGMKQAFSFSERKTGGTKARRGQSSVPLGSSALADPEVHPNLLCVLCDVRVRASVAAVLSDHFQYWGDGRLNIVANCSGYGIFGSCEDQDDAELRNQFETNFWGTLNIVQLTLPHMRANGGGRYLIFSSTSGALGVPGLGPYCATKYAVEGLVESMHYEIDAFDIRATLVSPGHVRRDDPEEIDLEKNCEHIDKSGLRVSSDAAASNTPLNHLPVYSSFVIKPPSPAYNSPTSPAFHAKRVVQWMADSQPTSVVKAAELVWQLAHCSYPPLRLLLGSFAVDSVRDRLRTIMEEIEDWKFLSFGEEVDTEKAKERILGKEPSREDSEDGDEIVNLQQLQQHKQEAHNGGDTLGNLGGIADDEDISDMDEEYCYYPMEDAQL